MKKGEYEKPGEFNDVVLFLSASSSIMCYKTVWKNKSKIHQQDPLSSHQNKYLLVGGYKSRPLNLHSLIKLASKF